MKDLISDCGQYRHKWQTLLTTYESYDVEYHVQWCEICGCTQTLTIVDNRQMGTSGVRVPKLARAVADS